MKESIMKVSSEQRKGVVVFSVSFDQPVPSSLGDKSWGQWGRASLADHHVTTAYPPRPCVPPPTSFSH